MQYLHFFDIFSFYPEIFNASGCPANVAKFGDWFSYENTPRAKIFRRDQEKVNDTDSMTRLMRYEGRETVGGRAILGEGEENGRIGYDQILSCILLVHRQRK